VTDNSGSFYPDTLAREVSNTWQNDGDPGYVYDDVDATRNPIRLGWNLNNNIGDRYPQINATFIAGPVQVSLIFRVITPKCTLPPKTNPDWVDAVGNGACCNRNANMDGYNCANAALVNSIFRM
jgi:hypothetical protein